MMHFLVSRSNPRTLMSAAPICHGVRGKPGRHGRAERRYVRICYNFNDGALVQDHPQRPVA